ncbi:MAG: glycosyltransferase [Chloroflexi bacterium]|nr:glycosyltransferase [Chloroflexota bacterium]
MRITPSVAIVIPCYNHWELTRNVLTDIRNLTTYPDYRVIVVDDGSRDHTAGYLETEARELGLRLDVITQPNRGFSSAVNRGIVCALAHGDEYILLLNNDVEIWEGEWLDRLVAPLEGSRQGSALPSLLVGADYIDYNEATRVDGQIVPYVGGWCMMMPRSLPADIGLFDEAFNPAFYEDVDYSARAAQAGYRLLGLGEDSVGIHHLYSKTATDGHLDIPALHAKNGPLFLDKIRAMRGTASPSAAPKPTAPRPKIAFYCYSNMVFDDSYLDNQGLGGAESALVQLSRELVRQGCEVTIFNRCPSPSSVQNGVTYRFNTDPILFEEEWDELVLFREGVPLEFWQQVKAKRKVFFSTDQYTNIQFPWPTHVFPYVDQIVCISPYHRQFMLEYWGAPEAKTTYTNLGVHWPDYAGVAAWNAGPKRPYQLIYDSVPTRGLAHLADIFPRIRRAVPHAELVVTADFSLWGSMPGNEGYRAMFAQMPGVRFVGKVPRRELIRLQKESSLHVFPCDHHVEMPDFLPPCTSDGELFCLASLECQAAETPTLATPIGALRTTVESGASGWLLEGEPGSAEFNREFADIAIELLTTDRRELEVAAAYARWRAKAHFSYEVIAKKWIERMRNGR